MAHCPMVRTFPTKSRYYLHTKSCSNATSERHKNSLVTLTDSVLEQKFE